MPRHAARHRMDRVADVDAAPLELVRELAHVVLRLGDREPVARHDDHALRVREHHGDVLRGRGAHSSVSLGNRTAPGDLQLPERPEEDVRDRTAHRLGHHEREQRP